MKARHANGLIESTQVSMSTASATFITWVEAIHEAQTGGTAVRWLVCASGIGTALLSVTGVFIFLRKMGWLR